MIDIARLADHYDAESRDTYLSLYVDLAKSEPLAPAEKRLREIRAALEDSDARAALDAAWKRARDAVNHLKSRDRDARGAAVFVSSVHDFEEAHALAQPVPPALVLDSSPYVRPLARYADEYESFALALLDGERAAVYLVAEGRMAEPEHSRKLDLIGRHTKGGWSQMRYQRGRQNIVDKLLEEMVHHLTRLVDSGEASRVVLAGPGQAKRQLHTRLPAHVQERVLSVEDADFSDEAARDQLVQRLVDRARDAEGKDGAKAVARLKLALRRDELALTGAFAAARAARDGRVELLVILKDHKAGGAKCEAHQAYFEAGAKCTACGSKGTQVDLINEAVEGAARSDARIEFVDDAPFLREVGGVGALLRWE